MNKVSNYNGKDVFFTSDTHFNHASIIKYCGRPYGSVEEMDESLIANWNSVVPKDGIVFHLGDFAFCGASGWYSKYISRLNGRKVIIFGNHDKHNRLNAERPIRGVDGIYDMLVINVDGQEIIMCHYPFLTWYNIERGCWDLYGHFHTNPSIGHVLDGAKPLQYDVGVDNNEYRPISFYELKKIMKDRNETER